MGCGDRGCYSDTQKGEGQEDGAEKEQLGKQDYQESG